MANRRPRFERSSQPSPIRLTLRDIEIIRHVARHRFLRSSQIIALMETSRQQILRRLNLLYQHRYLERPRCQIDYYYNRGSRSLVYGLGTRGAAMLRRKDEQGYRPVGISSAGTVKRIFLEHTLQVAEFMVKLELACRQHRSVRLVTADEMRRSDEVSKKRDPFRWRVSVQGAEKIGLIPDSVFSLEWKDESNQSHRSYYFLESDLGTMPVTRQGFRQSSLFRKLLAYASTWAQNLHQSRLGLPRFRVLFVITSPERCNRLIETARRLEKGSGLFLFTEFQSINEARYLLTHPWQTTQPQQDTTLLQ